MVLAPIPLSAGEAQAIEAARSFGRGATAEVFGNEGGTAVVQRPARFLQLILLRSGQGALLRLQLEQAFCFPAWLALGLVLNLGV